MSHDVSGFSDAGPGRVHLFGGFCEREFAHEEMFHTISSALSTCVFPPNCLHMLELQSPVLSSCHTQKKRKKKNMNGG